MFRKLIPAFVLCAMTVPAFCQPISQWQIATIIEVKAHPAPGEDISDPSRYDVSVKVGDTVYVVLYTQPLGEIPAKYETGHELLVLVGKKTITYNNILGQSLQVPIESQRPVTDSKHAK